VKGVDMNVDKEAVEFDLKQAKAMLDNRNTPVDELRFMVNKLAYKLRVATAEPQPSFFDALRGFFSQNPRFGRG
jgi:hypothetical protein